MAVQDTAGFNFRVRNWSETLGSFQETHSWVVLLFGRYLVLSQPKGTNVRVESKESPFSFDVALS